MNVKGMDIKEVRVEAVMLGVDTYQRLLTVVGGPYNTEARSLLKRVEPKVTI
jgi:hypothetical protein